MIVSQCVRSCIIGQAMTTNAESEHLWALAFETSGSPGAVALGCGDDVVEARSLSGPRRHTVEFLPTVAALCEAHAVEPGSLRRIFVSSGPGSFTGLRIGITAARMIGLATGASIVAVPTLEVIAQNAVGYSPAPDRVVVVLDAKRGRVYAAAFVRQDDRSCGGRRYVAAGDPVEAEPERFLASQSACGSVGPTVGRALPTLQPVTGQTGKSVPQSLAVLGEGVLYHRAAVEASGVPILPEALYTPRVETVYRLGVARANEGRFDDRRTLIPTYVRPPEAEEKWERTCRSRRVSSPGGRQNYEC